MTIYLPKNSLIMSPPFPNFLLFLPSPPC
jgi:hypothetical protein